MRHRPAAYIRIKIPINPQVWMSIDILALADALSAYLQSRLQTVFILNVYCPKTAVVTTEVSRCLNQTSL